MKVGRFSFMKLVFGSDIHGSAYWCEKLANRVEAEKPTHFVLLGDLLYHGPGNPMPKGHDAKATIEILSKFKDIAFGVRGNCDSEVDQMVLPFPIMADYNIIYDGEEGIFLSHGHIYHKENMSKIAPCKALVNGHRHIYEISKTEHGRYVNIGSVALPKENRENSYGVYENGHFYIKNMSGDVLAEG